MAELLIYFFMLTPSKRGKGARSNNSAALYFTATRKQAAKSFF